MKNKKPYSERSDIQKIESNWRKISGLYEREDWSSAIVRAATAVEITANFVIRKELQETKKLDPEFVDSLLRWANGVYGKFNKILLPYLKSEKTKVHKEFKTLLKDVEDINKIRNFIVHSGQFKKKETANKTIIKSRDVILRMIKPYDSNFSIHWENA